MGRQCCCWQTQPAVVVALAHRMRQRDPVLLAVVVEWHRNPQREEAPPLREPFRQIDCCVARLEVVLVVVVVVVTVDIACAVDEGMAGAAAWKQQVLTGGKVKFFSCIKYR